MSEILVVDDEEDLVTQLNSTLTEFGYTCGKAANGLEAVLQVIEKDWDVVLMDIRMPKVDGLSALTIIHRLKPAIPVIMFTGHAGQGEMVASNHLGAVDCLLKPIEREKLLKAIEFALQKNCYQYA
jgi:DNA-binding NtrC family response regulator